MFEQLSAFAESMRVIRDGLAAGAKLPYAHERERWLVDASDLYRDAIEGLRRGLQGLPITSRGLSAFRDYLERYTDSAEFRELVGDIVMLRNRLAAITYAVLIDGDRLNVREPEGEDDLAFAIHQTFARFRQGAVKSYL